MYLLDTNICIAIENQNSKAVTQFYSKYAQCYVTTIVIAELYKGAYCSQLVEDNLSRIQELVSLMPTIVEFDQNAAIEFGIIQGELRRMGRPTEDIDALIAAVARSHFSCFRAKNQQLFFANR